MNPAWASGSANRRSTSCSTTSSRTRAPECIVAATRTPNALPSRICSRSMSPVDICGTSRQFLRRLACVPFPEPGEPNKTTACVMESCVASECAAAPANPPCPGRKALVMAHDQLRFNLVDGIHGHAHHDQQGSAAKVKVHVQPFQQEAGRVSVHEIPEQGQMLELDAGNHDVRNQAQDRQIDSAQDRKSTRL